MVFAQAPLDGEGWRDTFVHGQECPWCLDLREVRSGSVGGTSHATATATVSGGLGAGLARNWVLAVSATTVLVSLFLSRAA